MSFISKFRKIINYGLSEGVLKLLPFIILPVLSNKLGVEEFSKVVIYQNLVMIFLPLLSLGMSNYLITSLHVNDSNYKLAKALPLCVGISFLVFTFLFIFLSVFYQNKIPFFALIFAITQSFFVLNKDLLVHLGKDRSFLKINVIYSVFIYSLLLFLLFYYESKWEIRFYADITIGLLFVTMFLSKIHFFKNIKLFSPFREITLCREIISFSSPAIFRQLHIWVKFGIERYIIAISLGSSFIGMHGLSMQLSTILLILSGILLMVMQPLIYTSIKSLAFTRLAKLGIVYFIIVSLLSLVIYTVIQMYFLELFSSDYVLVLDTFKYAMIAMYFYCLTLFMLPIFNVFRKNRLSAIFTFIFLSGYAATLYFANYYLELSYSNVLIISSFFEVTYLIFVLASSFYFFKEQLSNEN